MATVTLGNIKFNWKGAWNSATSYVVDDVVSLSGSSYVCIQAGTNQNPSTATAYWEQMSSAGTNGTDLTTTLTTQGDIVYRDGSGLARLGAGTSGQFLKTQGTGANPVWAEVASKVLDVHFLENSTRVVPSQSANAQWFNISFTKTYDSSTSKLLIVGQIPIVKEYSDQLGAWVQIDSNSEPSNDNIAHRGISYVPTNSGNHGGTVSVCKEFTGLANGSRTLYVGNNSYSGSSDGPGTVNPNNSDEGRIQQTSSTFIAFEIAI